MEYRFFKKAPRRASPTLSSSQGRYFRYRMTNSRAPMGLFSSCFDSWVESRLSGLSGMGGDRGLFFEYAIYKGQCGYNGCANSNITRGYLVIGGYFSLGWFDDHYIALLKVVIRGGQDLRLGKIQPGKFPFPVILADNQHIVPASVKCQIPCKAKCVEEGNTFSRNSKNSRLGHFPQHGEPVVQEPHAVIRIVQKFFQLGIQQCFQFGFGQSFDMQNTQTLELDIPIFIHQVAGNSGGANSRLRS